MTCSVGYNYFLHRSMMAIPLQKPAEGPPVFSCLQTEPANAVCQDHDVQNDICHDHKVQNDICHDHDIQNDIYHDHDVQNDICKYCTYVENTICRYAVTVPANSI